MYAHVGSPDWLVAVGWESISGDHLKVVVAAPRPCSSLRPSAGFAPRTNTAHFTSSAALRLAWTIDAFLRCHSQQLMKRIYVLYTNSIQNKSKSKNARERNLICLRLDSLTWRAYQSEFQPYSLLR
jgi:hypothetical protein